MGTTLDGNQFDEMITGLAFDGLNLRHTLGEIFTFGGSERSLGRRLRFAR